MNLKNIGTKNVVTVPSGTSIKDAARMMRESHVGDVVVVQGKSVLASKKPIGILTDRDIVVSIVAFAIDPESSLVDDLMSPVLTTARVDDSFYHVLNLMKEQGIKRVPFVNSSGILEGIVSSDDIVATLALELKGISNITERAKEVELSRRRKIA